MRIITIRISIGFFLFSFVSVAQQISIKGNLKDTQNRNIPSASVSIIDDNGTNLGYNYSDELGNFFIEFEKPNFGNIHLEVSCLGYIRKTITMNLNSNSNQNLVLEEKIETLKEVIIEASQKVKIERDTTTIKVAGFENKTELTLEDLLKKLPGIEVLKDGSITAHGKSIDKLLLEGDDMFDKNYKLLSKNLDAKFIDAVQIIDNFEDNPILNKLNNSDKVALNLKFKKGIQNVWFGNITLGSGVVSANRWKESLNIGLLKKKIKLFYLSDYNNIGEKASDLINTNVLDRSTFSNDRLEYKSKKLYNINSNEVPYFNKSQSVFNKSFLNAISFNRKISSKLVIRGIVYITDDIQNQNSFAETKYTIDINPITYTENNFYNNHKTLSSTELELKYFANEKHYFTNLFIFKNNPNQFNNNLLFNADQISQSSKVENFSFYNHFNHTYQITPNKVLNNYVYCGQDKTYEISTIKSPFLNAFLNTNSSDKINQIANNKLLYFGSNSKLISKFKRIDLTNSFQFEYNQELFENTFLVHNTPLTNYENIAKLTQLKMVFQNACRYNFTKKLDITADICFLRTNFFTQITKNTVFMFNPTLSVNLKKTSFGNFYLSFSENNTLPEINQLTSNYQLIDYRSFSKGTLYNKPLKNSITSLTYTLYNDKKRYSIKSSLLYIKSYSIFNNESIISSDFNFSTYKQTIGGESYNFNFNFVNYFRSIKIASKIETSQLWNSSPINVNSNEFSIAKNYNSTLIYSATTYFKIPINFDFGFSYNYVQTIFNSFRTNNSTKDIFININYAISKTCRIEFNNSLYYVNQQEYTFNNLIINYNPTKSRFLYRLLFNNIRNEKDYTYITISNYTSYKSSVNLVPRYLICSAQYRF